MHTVYYRDASTSTDTVWSLRDYLSSTSIGVLNKQKFMHVFDPHKKWVWDTVGAGTRLTELIFVPKSVGVRERSSRALDYRYQ